MGHYSGMFNNECLQELLKLLATLQGKFMLTMYPNEMIEDCAKANGWQILKVERQISACKASARRKQIEWIVINYEIENVNQEALKVAA